MAKDPRDARTLVECEVREAARCRGRYEVSLRAEEKNRRRNGGRFICLPCSRRVKFSGRRNPNARHTALRDDFFSIVDSEGAAYLLGWIASDGAIRKGSIALFIHRKDEAIVAQWLRILGCKLPLARKKDLVGITLNSTEMVDDVCRWLDIAPGKKSHSVGFPNLPSDELKWAFLRGFFDGDGSVTRPTQARGPRCSISTNSRRFREAVVSFCGFKAYDSRDAVEWGGNNALDFLGRLYESASFSLPRKRDLYHDWCSWVPSLRGATNQGMDALFRWVRADEHAVPPTKARVSDSGYDLTVIKKLKQHGLVEYYDTGIKVQPAFGWYFDVVARSSLSKTGYVIANSVGVIDRTYTGTIIIALMRVDRDAPELELPARIAQMIPRPIVHAQIIEVDSLDETERGAGGFGSTGHSGPGPVR
jgi:deoxyuridine 5'-triphosphate nucleotidohydrolase